MKLHFYQLICLIWSALVNPDIIRAAFNAHKRRLLKERHTPEAQHNLQYSFYEPPETNQSIFLQPGDRRTKCYSVKKQR